MAEFKTYVEVDSFRSGQFLDDLKKFCFINDINLNISTTGLFYKTHYITGKGDSNNVVLFKKWVEEIVRLNQ